MSDQPKLIFADESKKLKFEDLSAKLIFADESKKLIFDITQVTEVAPDFLLIAVGDNLLIAVGDKLKI